MYLFPRLLFPWGSSHSNMVASSPLVPVPSQGLGKWVWARRLSSWGQPGPMGLGGSARHCTRPGLSPAHLRNGTWAPKYFLKATSSTFGLSHPEQEKLCLAGERREENKLLPCCSTQEKKDPQRNFCLQEAPTAGSSKKKNWDEAHFSPGPDRRPLLTLPSLQPAPERYFDGNGHTSSRLSPLTCSALPGGCCTSEQLRPIKKSLEVASFMSSKQNKTSPATDHTETPKAFTGKLLLWSWWLWQLCSDLFPAFVYYFNQHPPFHQPWCRSQPSALPLPGGLPTAKPPLQCPQPQILTHLSSLALIPSCQREECLFCR